MSHNQSIILPKRPDFQSVAFDKTCNYFVLPKYGSVGMKYIMCMCLIFSQLWWKCPKFTGGTLAWKGEGMVILDDLSEVFNYKTLYNL